MSLNLGLKTVKRGFVNERKFFLQEIVNPKTQNKHVLKIDNATKTLIQNDFYVKDQRGDYKLSKQRFFDYKSISTVIKDLASGDTKERKIESFIPTKRFKKRIIVSPDGTKVQYIDIDKEKGVETHSYYEKGKMVKTHTIEKAPEPGTFTQKLKKLKDKLDYILSEAFLF